MKMGSWHGERMKREGFEVRVGKLKNGRAAGKDEVTGGGLDLEAA